MKLVRKVNYQDLWQIAKIHKEQFKDHYLGNFSENLLFRFYKSFYEDKEIIFIVFDQDNIINGFIVGGELRKINKASSNFIKNNIPLYSWEIFCRPSTWLKSLQKLTNVIFKKKPLEESLDYTMDYTLLSIAVSNEGKGRGVASNLIDKFDEFLREKTNEYFLSVHDNNARALAFYRKKGFVKERHFNGEIQFVKKI